VERHGQTHPPRWLILLAAALVWLSADGARHLSRRSRPASRPVARQVVPPPRAESPILEFYYPADHTP